MEQQEKFVPFQKMPCPYSGCSGWVVFGKNFCPTCHRGIMVCPQCGKRMIARENPYCANCGYDGSGLVEKSATDSSAMTEAGTEVETGPPEESTQAGQTLAPEIPVASAIQPPVSTEQPEVETIPVVEPAPVEPVETVAPTPISPATPTRPATLFTAGLDSKEIGFAVAEVYRQAALGTLNMHRVVDTLEALRKLAADYGDPYEVLDEIDTQVGLVKSEDLRALVISFRSLVEDALAQKNLEQLQSALITDLQAGWKRLVGIYAEALCNWRTWLCLRVNQASFSLPSEVGQDFALLQAGSHYASIDEWDKTSGLFLYLVENAPTSPIVTAANTVTAAEVQYICFEKNAEALDLLSKAEQIAPTALRVLTGFGRYWLTLGEKEDLAKARARAEQSIQLYPQESSGHALLGDIYLAENNLEGAEAAYRKAIEVDPGQNGGYDGLFSLYERSELVAQKQDQFPQLIREMAAISSDPSTEYSAYTRVGQAISKLGNNQKALEWYQRAIDLDPSRQAAYLYVGNLYLDQSDYNQAEKYYRLGIAADPNLHTGYWNLGWMYELQSKWQAARQEYKKCIPLVPEKGAEFRNKIGEMDQNMGHTRAAIREFLKALKIDPNYTASLNNLHNLVDEMSKSEQERPTAQKIMDDLRAIQGVDYEFTYQNRCGNIDYYAHLYPEAIEHYQRALALSLEDAVVWGNIGRAYRGAAEWAKSREAFAKAFAFDSKQKDFDWETGTTYNEEANLYYSQGRYRESVDLYAQALQHMPEDDVVNSNLAGAWEQLISLESENRLAAIENAYQPMLKASQLQPERTDYRWRLEKLRLQKLVVENYGEQALDQDPLVKPLYLDVSSDLMEYVVVDQEGSRLLAPQMAEQAEVARDRFRLSWGVPLPPINFREISGASSYYEISFKEQFLVSGYLPTLQRFCPQDAADLGAIGVKGQPDDGPPRAELPGCWVNEEDWKAVESAGFPLWGVMEFPLRHLESVLTWFLDELVDLPVVVSLGQEIESFGEISASPERLADFTRVLRALARERVPLTPFPVLVAGFLECQKRSLDRLETAEQLRSLPEMRPVLPGNQGEQRYYQLPALEQELRTRLAHTGKQGMLAIPHQAWNHRFEQLADWLSDLQGAIIVVEAADLRPYMSSWLRMVSPNLPVLSSAELDADKVGLVQKLPAGGN